VLLLSRLSPITIPIPYSWVVGRVRESRRREEAKAEAEADADAEVEADADAEAEPGSVADRVRRVRRHGHARDHMQISYMMVSTSYCTVMLRRKPAAWHACRFVMMMMLL
jgi:hypothetical protein